MVHVTVPELGQVALFELSLQDEKVRFPEESIVAD
jgi:hypothetical protein